jgi:hypothetical protein
MPAPVFSRSYLTAFAVISAMIATFSDNFLNAAKRRDVRGSRECCTTPTQHLMKNAARRESR